MAEMEEIDLTPEIERLKMQTRLSLKLLNRPRREIDDEIKKIELTHPRKRRKPKQMGGMDQHTPQDEFFAPMDEPQIEPEKPLRQQQKQNNENDALILLFDRGSKPRFEPSRQMAFRTVDPSRTARRALAPFNNRAQNRTLSVANARMDLGQGRGPSMGGGKSGGPASGAAAGPSGGAGGPR
jgi:hypothetical protein